jgi:hypothetical protein
MTDDRVPPTDENISAAPPPDTADDSVNDTTQPPDQQPPDAPQDTSPDDLGPRLERLGGEPAPDITPEEFARLQQAGQIHIDPRGRVRTTHRDESDAGVSLRKRRAWYVMA